MGEWGFVFCSLKFGKFGFSFFLKMKNPLCRLKLYFSSQNLAKIFQLKKNHLVATIEWCLIIKFFCQLFLAIN